MQRGTRGQDVDDVRRHNLSAVLDLVHSHGRLSRAALTRITGLNRSTIASLVGELRDRDLVREQHPPARSSRMGRPSPLVEPRGDLAAIAINAEATGITVALVGLAGTVLAKTTRSYERPPTAGAVAEDSLKLSGLLLSDYSLGKKLRVAGAAAAVPGMVRESDGVVRGAPQLRWVDEPLGDILSDRYESPVRIANDANLGASAEYRFGAGRDAEDILYVHGGSGGIGAGILLGGTRMTGTAGYAGAVGHTLVKRAGHRCWCGARGCLETEVRQELLTKALRASGDSGTTDAVQAEAKRQLPYLATALKNVANILNPKLVILGGFLRNLDDRSPGLLQTLIGRQTFAAVSESMSIVHGQLGDDAVLIGAADQVFDRIVSDPTTQITSTLAPSRR